jgi:hypothetical protein
VRLVFDSGLNHKIAKGAMRPPWVRFSFVALRLR